MPADKRKMWLGDDVKFYEPIEELGGSFRSRLGNFQNFLLDRQDRGPNLHFLEISKDQMINFKEHIEETHRRLDRRFTYYDNPLIDEALEKWRGW